MSMFTYTGIILGVMVAVYILAKVFKLSTELSMLAAAIVGAVVGGFGIPTRHIAEGAITYLDINLIFITATLFMNILKKSGGVAFVVRRILLWFHKSRPLLLLFLTILLLVPGALTGAGSVTVLITGGMVATVLRYMGISKLRISAMMTAAGVNMPYVGFFVPLLVPCVIGAILTVFILGWKGSNVDVEKAFEELPEPPEKMNMFKVLLPFLVFGLLIFIGRQWPHSTPILGLPLMFLCAAVTSFLLSPIKIIEGYNRTTASSHRDIDLCRCPRSNHDINRCQRTLGSYGSDLTRCVRFRQSFLSHACI